MLTDYTYTLSQSVLAWCARWTQAYTGHVKQTLVQTLQAMEGFMGQVKVRCSCTYACIMNQLIYT